MVGRRQSDHVDRPPLVDGESTAEHRATAVSVSLSEVRLSWESQCLAGRPSPRMEGVVNVKGRSATPHTGTGSTVDRGFGLQDGCVA